MRFEILKAGAVAGVFRLDKTGKVISLDSQDAVVRDLWEKGVPGVESRYLPDADALVSVSVRFKPDDQRFAFNFLNILESVYSYQWRRVAI